MIQKQIIKSMIKDMKDKDILFILKVVKKEVNKRGLNE